MSLNDRNVWLAEQEIFEPAVRFRANCPL